MLTVRSSAFSVCRIVYFCEWVRIRHQSPEVGRCMRELPLSVLFTAGICGEGLSRPAVQASLVFWSCPREEICGPSWHRPLVGKSWKQSITSLSDLRLNSHFKVSLMWGELHLDLDVPSSWFLHTPNTMFSIKAWVGGQPPKYEEKRTEQRCLVAFYHHYFFSPSVSIWFYFTLFFFTGAGRWKWDYLTHCKLPL